MLSIDFHSTINLNSDARVLIYDINDVTKITPDLKQSIGMTEQNCSQHVALLVNNDVEKILTNHEDLLLISLESWTKAS